MPENPFVGPRPYRQDEPLFGRDAEAALLVDLLVGARVVVIQFPSGAGKSSLLEALLKPLLRERGFRLAPTCQIAWRDSGDTIPPWPGAQNPLLRDACLQLLGGEDVGGDLRQAVDRLECNPETALEDDQGLVLVFDQCEKLFQRQRTVRSEAALREFFAQVADVLRHPRRIALFALRHEYRSALDGYAGLVPTGFGNTYTLDFLRCPQAREVLEKTFATRGVEVTPEAVALLVDEQRGLGTNPSCTSRTQPLALSADLSVFVEPLHLQAHGFRLWNWLEQANNGHVPRRVDAGDLLGMPSVADALGDYYDETVKAVAAEAHVRERDLRDWIGGELVDSLGHSPAHDQEAAGGPQGDAGARASLPGAERGPERRRVAGALARSPGGAGAGAQPGGEQEFQRRAASYAETHFEELLVDGKDLDRAVAWAEANPDEINEDDSRLLTDSLEAERKAARGRRRRTQAALALLGGLVVILGGLVALSVRLNGLRNEARQARERADQALLASRSHAVSQRALDLSTAGPASDTAMLLAVQAGRHARQHMETATTPAGSGAGALAPAQPSALFQLALSVTDAAARHPPSGYSSRLLGEVPGVSAAVADAAGEVVATGDSKGGVAVWRRTGRGWQPEGQWVGPGCAGPGDRPAGHGSAGSLARRPDEGGRAGATRGRPVAPPPRARHDLPRWKRGARVGRHGGGHRRGRERWADRRERGTKGQVVVRTRAAGSGTWASRPLAPALGDRSVNAIVIGSSHRTLAAAGWGRIRLWRGLGWRAGEAAHSEDLMDGGEPEFARVRALALTADERELWAVGDIRPQDRREAVVGTVAEVGRVPRSWAARRSAPRRGGPEQPGAPAWRPHGGRRSAPIREHPLLDGRRRATAARAHEGGTVALLDYPPTGSCPSAPTTWRGSGCHPSPRCPARRGSSSVTGSAQSPPSALTGQPCGRGTDDHQR